MQTVTKGNIGVAMATADLLTKGFEVFVPVDAAAPYDLLVLVGDKYYRVQVKFRNIVNGTITFSLRRATGNKGKPILRHNNECDVVCIYCPQTKECYYVLSKKTITIRFNATKSGHSKNVTQAQDCKEFPLQQV